MRALCSVQPGARGGGLTGAPKDAGAGGRFGRLEEAML